MRDLLTCALLAVTVSSQRHEPTDTLASSAADSVGRFPQVSGRSLDGVRFDLPAEFRGRLNLVVVAFQRAQQRDVDDWMPYLRALASRRPDIALYELPTLGSGYRWMRGIIDGGMRRGIPDAAVRAATITLYIDKRPFRRALELADENQICVLVVDRQGRIYWRAEGRFNAESAADLTRRLGSL